MLAKKILETIPLSVRILRSLCSAELNGQLSLNQIKLLKLILDGHGQTAIGADLDVSLAAVSKMIVILEKKRLISRKSGKDKRTHVLRVTAKGKKLLAQVTSKLERQLHVALGALSASQAEELMRGLSHLELVMQKVKKD